MNAFSTELLAVPNPQANEQIVCGLLAVTPNRVFFDYSNGKLRKAEEDMPGEGRGVLHGLLRVMASRWKQLAENSEPTRIKSMLDYLDRYDDGLLRFSTPTALSAELDEDGFSDLFNRVVAPGAKHPRRDPQRRFEQLMRKNAAVNDRADIGYELPYEKLPGLVLPARVGMITANGRIMVAQAVDLEQDADTLLSTLGTNAMIHEALVSFGRSAGLEVEPMKLVVHHHANPRHAAFAERLRKEKGDVFEVQDSSEFQTLLNKVERDGKFRKFSELIAERDLSSH